MIETRPKVLAIDDHPENLVVLGAALKGEFDFQFATSGEAGIRLAEKSTPDLILLDVMMPEVDGFETCRRLKSNPMLMHVPIVFITALNDIETEAAGLSLGAADYITKPFKAELVKLRVHNIIRLTRVSQQLKDSEERLRLVMNATGDGIWDWNIETGKVQHNATWCTILGLSEKYLEHDVDRFLDLIHPEDVASVRESIAAAVEHDRTYSSQHRMRRCDGHYIWVEDHGQVVRRDAHGKALRMVGAISNIDARKADEAQIHRLAFYDSLTELPNRRLLLNRLQQSLVRNQRSRGYGALMFMDLDRFKMLNDTHGHSQGDLLLIQVAQRLLTCVREQDTVARFGGDEFVILLEDLSVDRQSAMRDTLAIGNKVLETLDEPYQLLDLTYSSTPSIGITLFSDKSESVDAILKRADEAMYAAKAAGRNTIRFAE